MATLGAPKAVSPLIRFARYAAFGSGLLYGIFRLRSLEKKEVVIQEHENKIRAQIAERVAREKAIASKAEMDGLAKEAGIVPKA
ncbi:uncharacterized protein LOC135469144 [Liolophura sinensis]|uniref:uncharacterized protein LOC135469144 n=1 Tax=Liolophura sinensis TaxID=3198878 RepID=UPI0031590020